jgi:hypothetical protein
MRRLCFFVMVEGGVACTVWVTGYPGWRLWMFLTEKLDWLG